MAIRSDTRRPLVKGKEYGSEMSIMAESRIQVQ